MLVRVRPLLSLQSRAMCYSTASNYTATDGPTPLCSKSGIYKYSMEKSIDFDSSYEATAGKSTFEVLRGWLVFKLFTSDRLVDNSYKYYELSKKLLGSKVTESVLKATVFGQFAGGLNERETQGVAMRLAEAGVSSIWNYCIEKDLEEKNDKRTEADIAEEEKVFQTVKEKYLKSIKMSAAYNCDPTIRLVAIKPTPIVNPNLVMKLNKMLEISQSVFDQLASLEGPITDRMVSMDTLRKELPSLLEQGGLEGEGGVDAVQWTRHFSVTGNINRFQLLSEKTKSHPDALTLSGLEMKELNSFLEKLDSIGICALKHGVRVLVDAEQTYFQALFDHLVLHYLMPRYNTKAVVFYNTLQAYLKSTMDKLLLHLATTADYGVHCGVKLVRGAYMEQERHLARTLNQPDPIHPTKVATDDSYNSCITHLLEAVPNSNLSVIIASHNKDSVQLTINKMRELGLSKTDRRVSFGQLLGMGDHLSYPLASAGYIVSKVLAYGSLDNMVPFLSRRAQENRSLMVSAEQERKIYEVELKRRLTGRT